MNEYRFSDLFVGQKESFFHKVTAVDMERFLNITEDVNPLHNDGDFAVSCGFDGRVVYGMLTASLISTLAGVYLPGKYCLIHEVDTKFLHPVYIGDTLTVTGEVKELSESVQMAEIKVTITRDNGEKVAKGTLKAGFLQ